MRFEQLKRKSNAILRKKLYKSGKNWLVATSLVFAGGIILGSSPMVVKADNVDSTNTPQTESTQITQTDNSNTPKVGNGSPSPSTSSESEIPKSQSISSADKNTTGSGESQTSADSKVSPVTPAVSTAPATSTAPSTPVTPAAAPVGPASSTPDTATSGLNDPNNLTSSLKFGNFGVGTDNDGNEYSGSAWYLNNNGDLHIEAGNWAPLLYISDNISSNSGSFWKTYYDDHYDQIKIVAKKIVFDGPIIAGDSVSGLFFGFSNIESIENLGLLDTSNTKDFSNMFEGDKKLTQFIMPTNISNATNVDLMYAETGIREASLKDWNIPTLTGYSGMFNEDENLKSVDLSGLKMPQNADLAGMFEEDSNLTNIKMDGISIGSIARMDDMFQGCSSLESLDLSAFKDADATKTPNALNFNLKREVNQASPFTLTLNNSSNYINSALSFDENTSLGWIINDGDRLLDSGDLTKLYDGTANNIATHADANGNTTWKLKQRDTVNATINYWTKNQDQSKENPAVITHSLQFVGSTITVPSVPGYTDPENSEVLVPASGVINVIVSALPSYNLGINVSYTDNQSENTYVKIMIPARTTDFENSADLQTALKKLPNDNTSLNLEKTTINIATIINDPDYEHASLKSIIQGPTTTNLRDLINIVLGELGSSLDGSVNGTLDKDGNINISDFVNAVYDKYEAPVVKPDNNTGNSGGHHSTSPTEPVIPDVKDGVITKTTQTSATFGNNSKVQLYDTKGKAISNMFLSPNSSWYNDESMELSGKTYYRVATDRWVNADDVYIYTAHTSDVQVLQNDFGHLVNAHGQKVTDRELSPMSAWFTDRYTEINGKKYYRVATNEFISSDEVHEY